MYMITKIPSKLTFLSKITHLPKTGCFKLVLLQSQELYDKVSKCIKIYIHSISCSNIILTSIWV